VRKDSFLWTAWAEHPSRGCREDSEDKHRELTDNSWDVGMLVVFDISGDIRWAPSVGQGELVQLLEKSHDLEILTVFFFFFIWQCRSHLLQVIRFRAICRYGRLLKIGALKLGHSHTVKASRWSIEICCVQVYGLGQGVSFKYPPSSKQPEVVTTRADNRITSEETATAFLAPAE
jgi:hypothetical protein